METVDCGSPTSFLDGLKKLNDLPNILTQEAKNKIFLDFMDLWKKRDPLLETLTSKPVATVSNMVSEIVSANTYQTTSFDDRFATEGQETKKKLSGLIPEWEFWAREGWIFPHSNRDLLQKPRIPKSYFWSAWGIVNFIVLCLTAVLGRNYLVIDSGLVFLIGLTMFCINGVVFSTLFKHMESLREKQARELECHASFIDGKIKLYKELRQNQAVA